MMHTYVEEIFTYCTASFHCRFKILKIEDKLFTQVFGQQLGQPLGPLNDKFCTGVDLKEGLLAK